MSTLNRGYQGKRYRVYDHETEGYFDLSADELQCVMWFSEKRKKEGADAGPSRDEPPVPKM
jgi:hypothetical protein